MISLLYQSVTCKVTDGLFRLYAKLVKLTSCGVQTYEQSGMRINQSSNPFFCKKANVFPLSAPLMLPQKDYKDKNLVT